MAIKFVCAVAVVIVLFVSRVELCSEVERVLLCSHQVAFVNHFFCSRSFFTPKGSRLLGPRSASGIPTEVNHELLYSNHRAFGCQLLSSLEVQDVDCACELTFNEHVNA